MDTHVYKDNQGKIIQAVSSSIPGLSVVPIGMTIEDADPVSKTDYDKIASDFERPSNPSPSLQELQGQIIELNKMVNSLSQSLTKKS